MNSTNLEEKARSSQVMKDTADNFYKKKNKQEQRLLDRLETFRDKISKEQKSHDQSPSYCMTRYRDGVSANLETIRIMKLTYEKRMKKVEEEYEEQLQRIRKRKQEEEQSLFDEYEGENGKLLNGQRRLDEAQRKLTEEQTKKPKALLDAEYDYKKLLKKYATEFQERPKYFFQFLEEDKKEAEEDKKEAEEEEESIPSSVRETLRMLTYMQQQQQEALQRAIIEKQGEQSSSSNARTIYGDISQLEQTKKPLTTPPPSVHNQEDSEQEEEEDEEQDKKDLEDYYRRQQSLKSMIPNTSSTVKKSQDLHHKPTGAIPPPVVLQKKKSIVNRIIQEKAPGVGTYGLP